MLGRVLTGAFVVGLLLAPMPASADGRFYSAQLPDLSDIKGDDAKAMLTDLITASVVLVNCDNDLTEGELALLSDSADILAREQLGLSIADYDELYYGPAFDVQEQAGSCEAYVTKAEPLLQMLESHGGSRELAADQNAAYEAHFAREEAWDAATEGK